MNTFSIALLVAVAQAQYGSKYDGNRFHGDIYAGDQFQQGRSRLNYGKAQLVIPDRESYIPKGIDVRPARIPRRRQSAPAYHAPAQDHAYASGYISAPARQPQFSSAHIHAEPVYEAPIHAEPIYEAPIHAEHVYKAPIHAEPVHVAPVYVAPVYVAETSNDHASTFFSTGSDELNNVKPFNDSVKLGENPWADEVVITPDPETWYSETQQFSPPRIPFVPEASKPIFAICEFTASLGNDTLGAGRFQFAQFPNKPAIYQYSLDAKRMATEGNEYIVTINELGVTSNGCQDTGDEFNPLQEIEYGIKNPYQDPSRGRIQNIEAAADSTFASAKPAFVLQNLEGHDSIIGRTLTLDDDNGTVQCCVIGQDKIPEQYVVKTYPYQQASTYGPHHEAATTGHY